MVSTPRLQTLVAPYLTDNRSIFHKVLNLLHLLDIPDEEKNGEANDYNDDYEDDFNPTR